MQKFIENKDFQNWNKHRRELDKHNLNLEIKQRKRPKLTKLIDRTRLLGRIHHWGRQQAKLTQQELDCNLSNLFSFK